MPIMSGYECTAAIRRSSWDYRNAIIIGGTAGGNETLCVQSGESQQLVVSAFIVRLRFRAERFLCSRLCNLFLYYLSLVVGMDDVVFKPFNAEVIMKTVEKVKSCRRCQRKK